MLADVKFKAAFLHLQQNLFTMETRASSLITIYITVHIGVCAALEHCFHRCSAPGTADHANAALPSSLDASSISRNVTARSDPRFRYSATAKPSTATCRMLCFGPCGQGLIAWTTQAVTSDADGNRGEKHAPDDAEYSSKAALRRDCARDPELNPCLKTQADSTQRVLKVLNPSALAQYRAFQALARSQQRNATQRSCGAPTWLYPSLHYSPDRRASPSA